MLGRFTIAEYALFGEDILRILREFDAYVRNEPAQGLEPTAARFAALHGKELNFLRPVIGEMAGAAPAIWRAGEH
jgi:hypothetical protein